MTGIAAFWVATDCPTISFNRIDRQSAAPAEDCGLGHHTRRGLRPRTAHPPRQERHPSTRRPAEQLGRT